MPLGTVTKGLVQGTGGFRHKNTCGNHPNYSIIKIGQNTEKSPGDLEKFAVSQTLAEEHQLTLVSRTLEGVK